MSKNDRVGFGIVLGFIAYCVSAAVWDFDPALLLLELLFKALIYTSLVIFPLWIFALLCGRWR